MKKTILIFGVISSMIISSCSTKEPAKTKEEIQKEKEMLEAQKNIHKLKKSSDSLDRIADSLSVLRKKTEDAYDFYIRLVKASGSEKIAWEKLSEEEKELLKNSKPK